MNVRTMPLSNLVEINPRVPLVKGNDYPFVEMECVRPGRRYVACNNHRRFTGGGSRFEAGDTLFARITPCLENGKIAQFDALNGTPAFGSTEFIVLRARKGVSDPAYVFYLAYSDIVRKPAIRSMSGASGRQRADVSVVKTIEVAAPPIEAQREVAAVLSAYDDLMENNTRRIAILEEMAQSLYREWFVHFRFPGYERVAMVESVIGLVPKGWRVGAITEAVLVGPPTKVPRDGEKPFVPMASLSNTSMLIDNIQKRTGNSGSKFKNGDTLFARITPCLENGKTGFVQFLHNWDATAFGSTEFIVLRSATLCPEYVYLLARSDEFRDQAIKSMTGATGRQRVHEGALSQFPVAQPDPATIARFREAVAALFRGVKLLADKNANLRRTRDLLLPRLMSGTFTSDSSV